MGTLVAVWSRRHQPDSALFALLEESGRNIQRSALLLRDLLADYPERSALARDILLCEQEGDRIAHDILHRYAQLRNGAKSIESADIHALTVKLDDIVDFAEATADQLGLFGVEAPMEQAQQIAAVLVAATEEVALALRRLRGDADFSAQLVEIHRLENEADRLQREAVASLFANGTDPMFVIRWKDIYESLESAVDACETVANVLEGVTLKRTRG
jgi:uncharacterized protein